MPDLPLAGGRLYEALRAGRLVLVAAERPAGLPGHVHVAKPVDPVPEPVLVRPDGYAAWIDPRGYFQSS